MLLLHFIHHLCSPLSTAGGADEAELWRGEEPVPRDRRISIIIRDEL
jgi:hypothetical protein